MSKDSATSSRRTPGAAVGAIAPPEGPHLNETRMSDPIGAEIGPSSTIDTMPGVPSNENGAIDGLPGRYERQDEEDAETGLDLTPAPAGASNG